MNMNSLVPLVVMLPLLGAASTLILGKRPRAQRIVAVATLSVVLAIGIVMLIVVDDSAPLALEVGAWQAPFGIVLIVDRLAALTPSSTMGALPTFPTIVMSSRLVALPTSRNPSSTRVMLRSRSR